MDLPVGSFGSAAGVAGEQDLQQQMEALLAALREQAAALARAFQSVRIETGLPEDARQEVAGVHAWVTELTAGGGVNTAVPERGREEEKLLAAHQAMVEQAVQQRVEVLKEVNRLMEQLIKVEKMLHRGLRG